MKYLLVFGASAILIFLWILVWPVVSTAMISTNATIASANITGLTDTITFSRLGLWLGILGIPLAVFIGMVWTKNQQ